MSRRKTVALPVRVRVYGELREVVARTRHAWVERRRDGSHVIHLGRLLLEGQEPGGVLDEPKTCRRCRQPASFATPRGRAFHPGCEGWLDVLPDEMAAQVIFGVAEDLGATILEVR